eukprot:TCALIF_02625-PA protein Name:"Protein of unknown function" AED:0.07 eAED:0.09 QI:0/0/0/0.33/1/1/3/0/650
MVTKMVPRQPHLLWILVANLTFGFVSTQVLNETCVWRSVKDNNTQDSVLGLSQDFLEFKQRFNPIMASFRGFHQFDDKLPPFNEACYHDMRKACDIFIQRTDAVLKGDVSDLDALYISTIKWECRMFQEGVDLKTYVLANVGHFQGLQSTMIDFLNNQEHLYDFSNVTDLEKPLIRLQSLPKLMDDITTLLRQGIDIGMTISRQNMPKIKSQFQAIQGQLPENSTLFKVFKELPNQFGEDSVRAIQDRAKSFIGNQLMPAYQKLENFISNEYESHARKTAGIFSFPNGRNIYQKCLEFYTTIDDITAEEIHQIGLEEVRNLKKSMLDVMKDLNVNMTFQEFSSYVRDTPGQTFQTQEELLDYFQSLLSDVINPKLPLIVPRELLNDQILKPSILPSPPGSGGLASFNSGSVDGKRAGAIFINLENLNAIKKFELMTLMMHEGNPGHNFHSGFKEKSPALPHLAYPPFGRHVTVPANFPIYSALSEGWGLYSEYLGLELGLYKDPYDLIGFYSWNLLRAARLVVDTGIHHYEWTAEKAVEYVLENTFLSRHWAEGQVNRYIDWPGQATAYKIGERYIKKMRLKYEELFGDQLSLPEFHRRILTCQVPLDKLEQCLGILDEMNGDPVVSALHNSSFNALPITVRKGGWKKGH